MKPTSVVTWLWPAAPGYRTQFNADHVNTLASMVRRHYPHPHRFICVTDMPKGIDPGIEVVKAWNDFAAIPSPHGARNPSCYRRLRAFHPEIGAVLGQRFVSLDLDTVVVGDLTALWDRPEDFVAWKGQDPRNFYNGSMWMLTAGSRPRVWTKFDPKTSPQAARAAGRFGSDQAVMSWLLGDKEATWGTADGVYSYRLDIKTNGDQLPENARITFWHGKPDPWDSEAQALPWVREHYRLDRLAASA